ncbi:MAG: AarF/ABC1/UbiB kinase family protein [Desulfobacteraceae bacterium]|nr:AarF/ABC1/UbiB kinase family protein [Desulfobacteraceae bacterium]
MANDKSLQSTSEKIRIDIKRYRKVRRFFAKIFMQAIWWDIILNRPILRLFRTPPLPRWQEIARQYRVLALEMGGVLIKLGQFLSIRVDILPSEVTSELAGLQDEVPPEKTEDIIAQVEEDFGRPVSKIFEWFSPKPLGAASLAQAHLAKIRASEHAENNLKTGEVVVKVQRPGIDVLVETDLTAIRLALGWLKFYKPITRQVDLDWLAEEFTSVTREELDFEAEAHNAEHLASDFADDPYIYIPKVYWKYCAAHTLTLENVSYIKIGDLKGIEAAGISRAQVADKVYNTYMRQVFETYFVHVDPHPGNLFVKPLPHPDEQEAGITDFAPGDKVPYMQERPFQIAFVDFGMAVTIPERMRAALREYAIGIGTHDAHKIVQSLVNAGTLMEGADLKRLEEVHEVMFKRLWGVRVGQFRDLAVSEARFFLKEYKDVIYDSPIQFQADMLFVARAVGILSGMAANLDPDFDVWTKTIPFAERYAKEDLRQNWDGHIKGVLELAQLAVKLPAQLERVLIQAQREKLTMQTSLAPDTRKEIQQLEKSVNRLGWMVAAAGLLISGANLYTGQGGSFIGSFLMCLSFLAFLWGIKNRR